MSLRVGHDNAKEHVVVELSKDGQALGNIMLDGASAEQHIQDVARERCNLNEQVIPDLDHGYRLTAMNDPAWRIPPYRIAEGRILNIRHPGIGWLSFVFPDKEAAQISEWLTKELPLLEK